MKKRLRLKKRLLFSREERRAAAILTNLAEMLFQDSHGSQHLVDLLLGSVFGQLLGFTSGALILRLHGSCLVLDVLLE